MVHIFIVNPKIAPKGYATKLREQLASISDLNYYVLTTREAGHEKELTKLVEKIFEGENIRIYCCGGSGTARNIVDSVSDLSRTEIGIVPLGRVNYLDGFDCRDRFTDIEALVNGDVIHTDYIKTNHGISLNSVSFGLFSTITKAANSLEGFRAFGNNIPTMMAQLHTVITMHAQRYDIQIGASNSIHSCIEMDISNVPKIGDKYVYSEDADITDGLASFLAVESYSFINRCRLINDLKDRSLTRIKNNDSVKRKQISKIRIRRENGAPIWVNLDGELVYGVDWEIEVIRQGLKMVVPKGVYSEL